MIITCIEKNLPIFSSLHNRFHNCQILKLQPDCTTIPYTDICLIDASVDLESILKILKNNISGIQYVLLYSTFPDLESFFPSYKGYVAVLHFEELINNPELLFRFSSKKTIGPQDANAASILPFNNNDLHWELLSELLTCQDNKQINFSFLSKWVQSYLNINKLIIYKSENNNKFLQVTSIGVSEDYVSQFNFDFQNPIIEYLILTRPFIALPSSVPELNSSGDEHNNVLKSLKMSGVMVLKENSPQKFLIFFSHKVTGHSFTLHELKNVKNIAEFVLNKEEIKIAADTMKTNLPEKSDSMLITQNKTYSNDFLRNFAMRTSNEFKNALVSIKTFTQLLPEKYKDTNFRKDFFNVISHEVSRIEQLMDTINFFSSEYIPNFKSNNLIDIIKVSSKLINNVFPLIKFQFKYETEELKIMCDEKWLNKAIGALFMNSAQAMENNGLITVIIKVCPKESRLNNIIEIDILDSGKGIAGDFEDKIFEPFFSTKPNGLGLGLTCARSIIEAHGGTLKLLNLPEGGTIAKITIEDNRQIESYMMKDLIFKN